ncbi:hypothetical protein [Tautonia marina]|uniref:hypothetical protein n=1 Tax=Tautonia marina TaxID=2653855 RepID=UPI0012604FB6|nr:hypothetical protein [Tautonia marina]
MKMLISGRVGSFLVIVAVLGIGGCGPENPKIADAPAYQPPPFTSAPPTVKGADGKSYTYGSNPEYQEAMEKMNASQGVGR